MKNMNPLIYYTVTFFIVLYSISGLTSTLAWQLGPELPAVRAESAAIQGPDQSIYLLGGHNATIGRVVSKLNPGDSIWTSAPDLDTSRFSLGVTSLGSSGILVIGGTGGGEASSEVLHYDYQFGDSQDLDQLLIPRRQFAFATDSFGMSYVIGGLDKNNNELFSVESYDANTGVWSSIIDLPQSSYASASIGDNNGNVFIFGGVSNGSVVNTALCYTALENTWINLASMPVAVRDSVAVFYNGSIYVLGGIAADGPVATVQVYNLTTGLWSFDTDLPEPVYSHAAALNSSGQIVVMGGYHINGIASSNVYLSQSLSIPESLPVITSSANLNASFDTFYNYNVTASGNPGPLFSLDLAPLGMTINAVDGTISWQPEIGQEGVQEVIVLASNRVGQSSQSFSINVLTDTIAPTVPTSLQVDAVTTSTVELSWLAASDANGVDHYNLYRPYKCGWRHSRTCYSLVMENIVQTSTILTGLTPLTWSSYVVRSLDAAGNISGVSNSVSVQTLSDPTGFQYKFNGQLGGLISVPAKTLLEFDLLSSANPAATYSIISGPQGIILDQVSGHIQWTPIEEDVGTHRLVVEASNTIGSRTLNIDITITSDVPQLTVILNPDSNGSYSAIAGVPFTAQVTDISNTQPTTYALITAPAGMTIDTASGFINWLPDASQGGSTNVTVQSTNSAGSTNLSFSFYTYFTDPVSNIQITNLTQLNPTASWTPPVGVGANLVSGYTLVATSRYRYGSRYRTQYLSFDSPGTVANIDLTGLVAGRTYKLSINAYDANGNRGLKTPVPVEFIPQPDLPVLRSTVDYGMGSSYAVVNQALLIQLTDANTSSTSTYSIVNAPANLVLDSVTGVASWTPSVSDIGITPIRFRATNAVGSRDIVINLSVPFSGPVQQVSAKTVSGTGLISASWLPPVDNAEPVTDYRVTMHWTWSGRKRSRSWTTSSRNIQFSLSPTGAVYHKGISISPIDAQGRFGVPTALIRYDVSPAPAPTNQSPFANAGGDQTIALPHTTVLLNGVGSDDGLPSVPGTLSYQWTVVTAPAAVSFGNANLASTTASFSTEGVYTLRLIVSDGLLSQQDDVVITINPAPVPVNAAPVANAGVDQLITLPNNSINLTGSASDDGLPSVPGSLSYQWSIVSAPGTVSFTSGNQASTSASFSAEGVYTLRLLVSDGVLSHQDDVIITVNPAPIPVNTPPIVNAGIDQALTLPNNTINLTGSAIDDGLPAAPGQLNYQWHVVSAPGTVNFGNASLASTTASFTIEGTYTLQLTVSDGLLSNTANIVVTVNPEPITQNAPPPLIPGAQTIEMQGSIQQVGTNYLTVSGTKIWYTPTTKLKFEDGTGGILQVGQSVELKGTQNNDSSITAIKVQVAP